MISFGRGKHKVFFEKQKIGNDLLIKVWGGDVPHIGSVVIGLPGKKEKKITYSNHKDYVVLSPIAKKAAEKFNCTVVAVGGIHLNNATKKDIKKIIENCKGLEKKLGL